MTVSQLTYRRQIRISDMGAIAGIVKSSGFFSAAEIDLACELASDKIADDNSSYQFLFGEKDGLVVGYTCFGLIPATDSSYDLYWIAVHDGWRACGLGKQLLEETEKIIRDMGGKRIYVETSSRRQYLPTHGFYERSGYHPEAFLKDFYAEDDSKVIYSKHL